MVQLTDEQYTEIVELLRAVRQCIQPVYGMPPTELVLNRARISLAKISKRLNVVTIVKET